MRYLLENWNEAGVRLRNAKSLALFLDFDGTLAPFEARPEHVFAPAPVRRALRRLANRPRMRIWVISGRRQGDVARRIGVPHIQYLGLYGSENGQPPALEKETVRALVEAKRDLAARRPQDASWWVEDKEASFALHYRGAPPEAIEQARAALEQVQWRFAGHLRVKPGDQVWEFLPRELGGKGEAVRHLWRTMSRGALPIYIGDDFADEEAFAVFSRGITVCVGPARPTRAAYRLRSPAEVSRALERMDQEVQ